MKNTAVAGSDNTEDDQDENTVVVKPPVLKIEKVLRISLTKKDKAENTRSV